MIVASGASVSTYFTTNDADGASADADSTPTGTLYVNGSANGATVTVTNISTGLYKAAFTAPAGSSGDHLVLIISATIDTVASKAKVWEANQSQLVLSAAQVNAEVDTAISDAALATAASIAALNDVSAADVATAVAALTVSEPAAETVYGTSTWLQALALILLEKIGVDAFNKDTGVFTQKNVAGNATVYTRTATDDGTTVTRGAAS